MPNSVSRAASVCWRALVLREARTLAATVLVVGCAERPSERVDGGSEPASPVLEHRADEERDVRAPNGTHRAVLVRVDHGSFTLENQRTQVGPLPRAPRDVVGPGRWGFVALDRAGAVIGQGSVAKPGKVHGEFPDPKTGKLERVDATRGGPHLVLVRVPSNAQSVRFFEAGTSGSQNVAGEVRLPDEVTR